jgi:hypothetical protein
LPGLLCFGAGFFNLIVPLGLSLVSFFGATLMVSSSLARDASIHISMSHELDAHRVQLPLLLPAAAAAMVVDGERLRGSLPAEVVVI